MAIKLVVEKKVNDDGAKGYVVKDFELLGKDKLPSMYLKQYPHTYKYNPWWMYIDETEEKFISLHRNEFFTVEEFQKIIEILQECGDRLREVNQKLRKLEEVWNGTVEFII